MTAVLVQPRKVRNFGRGETIELARALGIAIAVTAALWAITPLNGTMGFVFLSYLLFLGAYYTLAMRAHGRKAGADRVVTVVIGSAALCTVIPLILIISFVTTKGIANLRPGFFTETLEGLPPDAPATAGGALHAISGTLLQVGLATLVAVPFGVAAAVYLQEIGGRFVGLLRVIVDAMSGIPSIVAGLFIYSMWVVRLHQGFSGFAAALALGILMLPTVARTTEEMLKLVPDSLREASLALGSPQWRTVLQIVLPTARSGIVTAVILGVARVAGETAPLLMTAFGVDRVNVKQTFTEPQSSLPLFVYQQITNAQGSAVARAWTGAFVLILLVLSLFVLARVMSRPRRERN